MKNADNDLTRRVTWGDSDLRSAASTNEKAPRILTIDRSKWRRGGNASLLVRLYGSTRLLNDKGLLCCLGFDALACGLSEDDIRGSLYPSSLVAREVVSEDSDYARLRVTTQHTESPIVDRAISHNDDYGYTDSEREALIREDLMALGWDDVVFVGGGMASDARPTEADEGTATGSATKESESK